MMFKNLLIVLSLSSLSLCLKDYDYYAFASEWPGGVCKFRDCTEDSTQGDTFNMHGLWPNADSGRHPFYCSSVPTNFNGLPGDLKSQLLHYWSGLYSSQATFLDHEWTKHGTCWRSDYGEVTSMPASVQGLLKEIRTHDQNSADFLRFAITLLKEEYNLFDILGQSGIVPSTTRTYTFAEIKNAIKQTFGKGVVDTFKIKCNLKKGGIAYLTEIWLCLDKNYQPIDCRFKVGTSCTTTGIIYAPHESRVQAKARLF